MKNEKEEFIKPTEYAERLSNTFDCKQKAVRAVRFNVDGEYCLTCGADKTIKLWNPHKQLPLQTYTGHGNEVLDAYASCDNSTFCSCGLDKSVILWDVATGKILRKFKGHAAKVDSIQMNEEGSLILSGSLDGCVHIWDAKSRKYDPIQTLNEAKDGISCIYVTNFEIFTSSLDKNLRKYDVRSGRLITDFIGVSLTNLSLTMDSQCVLIQTLNNVLRLMDNKTGQLLQEYTGHKSKDFKIEAVVSSDDKQIFSGSEDGGVYIWDLVKGNLLRKLDHPITRGSPVVHSISHHPSKPLLLSAHQSNLFIWKSRFSAVD